MRPSSVQQCKPKRYWATVKCYATVEFYDDGTTELQTQAADTFQDGDFFDPEILDITDIKEICDE